MRGIRTAPSCVGSGVDTDTSTPPDLRDRIASLLRRYPSAVVAGPAAAALWCGWDGADVPVIDLVRPGTGARPRPGVVLRRDRLDADEVDERDGVRLTSRARTLYDLGRREPLVTAVVAADALVAHDPDLPDSVDGLARRHPHARGLVRLRVAVGLVNGRSRTPLVSRVRVALYRRAPRPVAAPVVRHRGRIVAVPDLGWPEDRCALLCGEPPDGPAEEVVRRLGAAGWRARHVAELTADDDASELVARVHEMLFAAVRERADASPHGQWHRRFLERRAAWAARGPDAVGPLDDLDVDEFTEADRLALVADPSYGDPR